VWEEIQTFLPEANRINPENKPEEIRWQWGNNWIHIDCYPNPAGKAKVILLHGVGGNGRLLSFVGIPLQRAGYEVLAPDLPGYGLSEIRDSKITYDHWIQMIYDLVSAEKAKDARPVVVFGLSAGGMLAYQVACLHEGVSGLIATCILDQRYPEVRQGSAINPFMGRIAIPLLKTLNTVSPGMKLPMKMLAKMRTIVNNELLLKLLLQDRTSSGVRVPVSLVYSLMTTAPAIEPEKFDRCPFLLAYPEKDNWTPIRLSRIFFDRLACEKQLAMLENAGHFPIEQPGIGQLEEAVLGFLNELLIKNK
jgi:pimeloyl-ACP methyl ester carboxylesterase